MEGDVFDNCVFTDVWFYLAKHVANADSGTCGPHTGSSPLHLVLAFWRAALSHSSRPRASLTAGKRKIQSSDCMEVNLYVKVMISGALFPSTRSWWCLLVPDSCQMAVVVDYVKVRHSAVALLLAWLVFKVLQGHTLCESVNSQDFGWLGQEMRHDESVG